MERQFATPTAPEGCGTDPNEGACYACTVRAARKSKRIWRLRQLLPLQYATHYTTGGENANEFANFDVWRMWFGKVFAHQHARYPVAK